MVSDPDPGNPPRFSQPRLSQSHSSSLAQGADNFVFPFPYNSLKVSFTPVIFSCTTTTTTFPPLPTMSALSSAFSGLWYKDASATTPGKVELPLLENEPLGSPLGKSEKCELRIEGMTCGSCVEVSSPTLRAPAPINFLLVHRGNAQISTRDPLCQSRPAGRTRRYRVRSVTMECGQSHQRKHFLVLRDVRCLTLSSPGNIRYWFRCNAYSPDSF
jgi:hypothetical protein